MEIYDHIISLPHLLAYFLCVTHVLRDKFYESIHTINNYILA